MHSPYQLFYLLPALLLLQWLPAFISSVLFYNLTLQTVGLQEKLKHALLGAEFNHDGTQLTSICFSPIEFDACSHVLFARCAYYFRLFPVSLGLRLWLRPMATPTSLCAHNLTTAHLISFICFIYNFSLPWYRQRHHDELPDCRLPYHDIWSQCWWYTFFQKRKCKCVYRSTRTYQSLTVVSIHVCFSSCSGFKKW